MSELKLGDAVAKVTTAMGIKPCEECKKRQAFLNDLGGKLASLFGRKDEDKKEV